jgi:hypothetical protein
LRETADRLVADAVGHENSIRVPDRPPARFGSWAIQVFWSDNIAYKNTAHPHRSLGLEPPAGPQEPPPSSVRERIVVDPLLSGLHHLYRWAA